MFEIFFHNIADSIKKSALKLIEKQTENPTERVIFDSELPVDIDWNQINDFFKATGLHKQLLSDNRHNSDAFTHYPVSETSKECIKCLHEDLRSCYGYIFVYDENGNEDRWAEYKLLNENLHSKYGKLSEDILSSIYNNYLKEDR